MKTLKELREKTLTPAEKKKREEIAKAMEKDNPDMPMDKKMAIATATAKRVAESDFEPHMMYDPKTGKGYKAEKPEDHVRMKKMGYTHEKPEVNEGKMKQAMMRRQDMAKLAGLYSKAMKAMPGSPAQKKIKAQIDQYRRELGMNESLDEQKDDAEYNDEGGMAISQLKTAKSAVEELMSIIKDDDNLPEWVQSKLTKAVDYMDSVRDYMASEKGEVQEAVKTTHVVIDTADGNKVVATASSEQGAKSSVASAERPPISIKNKRTLKIVKLKKPVGDKQVDRMVGYPLKEAVSPAQQAAIAIAKKEKGEKPEVKEAKDDLFQVNVKGEGGATVRAKSEKDAINKAFRKLGIATRFTRDRRFMTKVQVVPAESVNENYRTLATKGMGAEEKGRVKVGDEVDFYETERGDKLVGRVVKVTNTGYVVQSLSRENKGKKYTFKYHDRAKAKKLLESRAYRDAMRGLRSKSATRGMATTKKDKDIEASDDDRKAASKNIIMQLRKAADLPTGAEVEFERGKGKVSRSQAQDVLAKFNRLPKPRDREQMQKSIKSLADIKKILGR